MATINEIDVPWRAALLPAHFDGNLFHVDTGAREGGRRIVLHEFPKKDLPYAEDMGRAAGNFTVRGYCITYPYDAGLPLYSRDYRVARNLLQQRLDEGGPGNLQLPTMAPMLVVCQRYRLTEEEKFGGYCVFDMQFVEHGAAPLRAVPKTDEELLQQSNALKQRVLDVLSKPPSYQPRETIET
jgi:prophage DNA circulation protein